MPNLLRLLDAPMMATDLGISRLYCRQGEGPSGLPTSGPPALRRGSAFRRTIESMASLADVLEARTAEAAPELVERIGDDRLALSTPAATPAPSLTARSASARCASTAAARSACPGATSAACSATRSRRSRSSMPGPGALAFSFGMLGCDLHCSYCQNWVTSQALRDPQAVAPPHRRIARADRVARRSTGSARTVVVSTYNEPLITSEWAVAIFKEARAARPDDRRTSRMATARRRCSTTSARGSISTRSI